MQIEKTVPAWIGVPSCTQWSIGFYFQFVEYFQFLTSAGAGLGEASELGWPLKSGSDWAREQTLSSCSPLCPCPSCHCFPQISKKLTLPRKIRTEKQKFPSHFRWPLSFQHWKREVLLTGLPEMFPSLSFLKSISGSFSGGWNTFTITGFPFVRLKPRGPLPPSSWTFHLPLPFLLDSCKNYYFPH